MIVINPKSNKPIYEQIVVQMKENILRGYVKEGDAIPSTRKLAMMIGVNPNTVARAYQELERQKLIETMQGKGTFIAGGWAAANAKHDEEALAVIREKLKNIVIEMRYKGLTKNEIQNLITEIYDNLKPGE